jgi:divalent metal cation (Fe/Co/Zn/Cd) transporter
MSTGIRSLDPVSTRRDLLVRRIRLFVAATITYNVIEGAVALTAGMRASSTALVGFGLDSLIEVSSAAAVAWQFAGRDPEAREKVALRVIGFLFFGLAAFVVVDAMRSLLGGAEARHSTAGLVLAAVSLAVMPLLSWGQRRAGRELGSRSAVADSTQTLLCTYLSAVLLIGLAVNTLFGWWWADPVAGLGIAALAVREGVLTLQGRGCCAPDTGERLPAAASPAVGRAAESGCSDACCTGACCTGACCTGTDGTAPSGSEMPER